MSEQFSFELLSTERTQHDAPCEIDWCRYITSELLEEDRLLAVSKLPPYADRAGHLATLRIRDNCKVRSWFRKGR